MSDRLINADAFKKEWFEIDEEEWESKDIRRLIDEQPTAYDVDEKIKRIEKLQEDYSYGTGSYEDYDDYYQGGANALSEALDILKGGAK